MTKLKSFARDALVCACGMLAVYGAWDMAHLVLAAKFWGL